MIGQGNPCFNCYWHDKCSGDTPCEDFTPLDDSLEVAAYQEDLREREEEYAAYVKEMKQS